jgi:hypothetical protein
MKRSKLLVSLATVGVVAILGVFALQRAPRAQSEASPRYAGPDIPATGTVSASGPVERTPEAIAADAALAPSGPMPAVALEVRPTIPRDRYAALKAAANAQAPISKPIIAGAAGPSATTPTLGAVNFAGAKEGLIGRNEFPSDDDMDVSGAQIAQVTNASLWVFNKSGTILAQHSLNTLLGTTHFLGDPQILFDSTWKRWVISVDDFSNLGSSFNLLWLAVSKTSDATGAWFVYAIGFSGGPFTAPNFLDYPHLGMDQDALLFTGNIFNNTTGSYVDTTAFAIAKARAYNGYGFSFGAFTGLIGTLMPPVQLGAPWYSQYPFDYFAAAVAGSGVSLYTMSNAGKSGYSLSGPVSIPGTNFSVPPNAVQPGCADALDTLDGRFQNACYQVPPFSSFSDGLLYCVHTVQLGAFPAPLWDAFNPATNTVSSSGFFFLSITSDDFNPAIAADAVGNIFVTETATDTGKKPMVLFGGALAGNAVTLNATPASSSLVCLTGNGAGSPQRWGDYSAARFDPATSFSGTPGSIIGWITNQKVAGASAWGTKIAKIKE